MLADKEEIKIAYACPSYRRPHCITADYIHETRIYVDRSDYDDYIKNNEHGEVVMCDDGVQGNLPRVRNYILDKEFKNGADIVVMMDDDISYVGMFRHDWESNSKYAQKVKREDLDDIIINYSILCEEFGFGMWVFNYNNDGLLYKEFTPFSTTKVALGQFVVFVKNELRYDENLPLKEDYDMAVQQARKYRGVLTVNCGFVKGDFGKLAGGTTIRRNHKREFEQFKLFKKKWGSGIVRGVSEESASSTRLCNGEYATKGYVNKYDFSHPVVRIPIDGV